MTNHTPVFRRTWPIFTGALVVGVALLSSCGGGGDKKIDVDDWVKANCDIMQDFEKASDKAGEGLDDIDLAKRGARDDVVDVIKDFEKERKKLSSERKKTGRPDVKGGAEVVAAINRQQDLNDKAFAKLLKGVAKLDDGKNFEADLFELFLDSEPENDLRANLEDLADKRETEGAQDVLDALDDDPECAATFFGDDANAAEEPASSPTPARTVAAGRSPVSSSPVARATLKATATKDEKWVIGLCNAVQGFGDDIDRVGTGFTIPQNANGQAIKDALVTFMTELQKRSATLKNDIDKLGNPDGKDGAKIQAAFSQAAGQVVTLFDGAVRDARNLNANDQAKLLEQLGILGSRLEAAGTAIGNTFDRIDRDFDTASIDKIADSAPQCIGVR